MMIFFLQRFTEDHDYALHVLLPELIELLLLYLPSKEEDQQNMLVIHIMESLV